MKLIKVILAILVFVVVIGGLIYVIYDTLYGIDFCTNLCKEKGMYYDGGGEDYCKCLNSNGELRIFDRLK